MNKKLKTILCVDELLNYFEYWGGPHKIEAFKETFSTGNYIKMHRNVESSQD